MWASDSLGKKNQNLWAMNMSKWRYYSVTWVLSENILLWYILYQKTINKFEFKKVDFFIKIGKNRFLLKTKSLSK